MVVTQRAGGVGDVVVSNSDGSSHQNRCLTATWTKPVDSERPANVTIKVLMRWRFLWGFDNLGKFLPNPPDSPVQSYQFICSGFNKRSKCGKNNAYQWMRRRCGISSVGV